MSEKYILLVEDDPTQAKVWKKIINKILYDVATLSRGSEVLRFLSGKKKLKGFPKEKLGLILLDLSLNKVSGFDILKTVQDSKEDIPIIVFSASEDPIAILESGRLGAKNYIVKWKKGEVERMFFAIDEFMKQYL